MRSTLDNVHWPLLAAMTLVTMLGIYNLSSASAARDPHLYFVQLSVFGLGLALIVALLTFDYRVTESLAYIVYGVVVLLLLAVLLNGRSAGGARRWLGFGSLSFQPSELAKIATIAALARYFGHRAEEAPYSLARLVRPLNLSRPVAAIGLLVLSWRKPWLVDPVGELARFVHAKVEGVPPPIDDLVWFRAALLLTLAVGFAFSVLLIFRAQEQRRLLDPWPPGRRRRLVMLTLLVFVALAALVTVWWRAPVLRDPFGVAIAALVHAGGPGGSHAALAPVATMRVVLVIAVIAYFAASLLAARSGLARPVDLVIAPVDLMLLPAGLILVEPDLGTAGLVVLIGLTMVFIVGVQLRSLVTLGGIGAAIAAISWFGVLKDYQKRRILTFIDPEHDIKGAGWHAVQSLIAVGSGRWWGKGHRGGTQSQLSFLPEQHTDFAFSVWAEEQGFFGCLVVLVLYAAILIITLAVAAEARERYGALLATGVAAMIFWQAIVNVGMVSGLFPVVGMTLPLFSYGGSSLTSVMVGFGLVLSVHYRRRAH
ncbi:MAG: FtsW/RodA/SpoVE family cell cycle protein [Myxococcota bacterium]